MPHTNVRAFILCLLAIDVGLGCLFLFDYAVGSPQRSFARLINLGGEKNLPTGYSALQLLGLAVATVYLSRMLLARNAFSSPVSLGRFALYALPVAYLVLSLDELLEIHEHIGGLTDYFLPNQTRDTTIVSKTGIWFVVIGVPTMAFFLVLANQLRKAGVSAKTMVLYYTGLLLFFGSALVVEAASNWFRVGHGRVIQLFVEEVGEMAGVTLILWATLNLLVVERARLSA